MPDLLTGFALVAVVLTVAGLASGIVERAPLSFPILFLGLGFLLGGHGLGLLHFDTESPLLEAVATLTLAMVLCLEAVRIGNIGMGGAGFVPVLSLGPGTVMIVAVIAAGSYLLLNVSVVEALLLGTILASTDPVVLRDVVREERIPSSVRQALNIEAGTNDIVVLPTLLILIALANDEASGVAGWTRLVAEVLVLGPVVGFAIGAGAAWLMSKADRRYAVNEVYQSLYGVGIVLLSYAAATALGGDGFLAAFAIFVARPLAIGLVLRNAAVSNAARAFIGWFGPRGLNSLLLALLVVEAGVANSEFLLGVVGVVVTVSVLAHGASATPLSRSYGEAVMRETYQEERDNAGGIFEGAASDSIRIKPDQLHRMLEGDDPPVVLDVRTRSQYEQDHARIPGAVRLAPDQVDEWARERQEEYGSQVEGQRIVAYCT